MARSNRQITQLTCDAVNTRVEFQSMGRGFGRVLVKLFGKPIMECVASKEEVTHGALYTGDFYDSLGRPSRTTRERLNGLLAQAGDNGAIPSGVRVFINKETGQCCVGKGEHCRLLDKDHTAVYIQPNPLELLFL
jgi:hypothetical protein